MTDEEKHVLVARMRAKFPAYAEDRKFMAGLDCLEFAEKVRLAGQIQGYNVLYCEDNPAVVHTVLVRK